MHFFDFSGRLLYETGLCAAVVQLLVAYTVQSMHAGIQHQHLYMTSHTINSIKSCFCKPQATATIQKRLMRRHEVAKVRLLFKSSFYSRAAFKVLVLVRQAKNETFDFDDLFKTSTWPGK